jgi:hypothetical protein
MSDRGIDPEAIYPWLDVIITELESDIQHLECGQERFCRFEEPKALTEIESNFNCADDRPDRS